MLSSGLFSSGRVIFAEYMQVAEAYVMLSDKNSRMVYDIRYPGIKRKREAYELKRAEQDRKEREKAKAREREQAREEQRAREELRARAKSRKDREEANERANVERQQREREAGEFLARWNANERIIEDRIFKDKSRIQRLVDEIKAIDKMESLAEEDEIAQIYASCSVNISSEPTEIPSIKSEHSAHERRKIRSSRKSAVRKLSRLWDCAEILGNLLDKHWEELWLPVRYHDCLNNEQLLQWRRQSNMQRDRYGQFVKFVEENVARWTQKWKVDPDLQLRREAVVQYKQKFDAYERTRLEVLKKSEEAVRMEKEKADRIRTGVRGIVLGVGVTCLYVLFQLYRDKI